LIYLARKHAKKKQVEKDFAFLFCLKLEKGFPDEKSREAFFLRRA